MTFYVDVYSRDTYEEFLASDRKVAGFDDKTWHLKQVQPGDKLIGYIKGDKLWATVLEVVGPLVRDETPRWSDRDDPYVNRFPIKPLVLLPLDRAVPIEQKGVWDRLSFTKDYERGSRWKNIVVRRTLTSLDEDDGRLLENALLERASDQTVPPTPPPDDSNRDTPEVQSDKPGGSETPPPRARDESIRVQASLAEIGSRMGLDVWIPANDRGRVEQQLPADGMRLLGRLPLNYDEVTNKTIEQIDVLWLKGRSIVRAFEVEHTTAVYSGLLRMADLLALQPNMDIRLHIVASSDRRMKVLQEIRRPVFERLEGRPLADRCTFLTYDSVEDLHKDQNLPYLTADVLQRYEERA